MTATPAAAIEAMVNQFFNTPQATQAAQALGMDLSSAKRELASYAESAMVGAMAKRNEALKCFSQGLALLREADNWDARKRVSQARDAATEKAFQARDAVTALEDRIAGALTSVRLAEDELRQAEEYKRGLDEESRTAKSRGLSPAEQTEALIRARTAVDVVVRYVAELDGAKAALASIEAEVATARNTFIALDGIRQQLEDAEAGEGVKGELSLWSALYATQPIRDLVKQARTDAERGIVDELVTTLANDLGIADRLRGQGRYEATQEFASRPLVGLPKGSAFLA